MKRGPCRLWHYTTLEKLSRIIQTEAILPSPSVDLHERPAVWFSTREDWEPTCAKAARYASGEERLLNLREMQGLGLVRLGIDPRDAPISWREHRQRSGIRAQVADSLEEVACAAGSNPEDWFVSYTPVSALVAAEQLDDTGHWVSMWNDAQAEAA